MSLPLREKALMPTSSGLGRITNPNHSLLSPIIRMSEKPI
jgi:hypothetical protein